jgi:hypothetical protein
MRITFSKLVPNLTPTFWQPTLALVLATALGAGCGGGSTSPTGSGGSGGSSAGTAGSSGGNSGGGTTGSGGTAGSAGTGVAGSGGSGGNVGSGGNSTAGAGGATAGSGGNVGSGGNPTAGAGGATAGSGGNAGNSGGGTTGGSQGGRGGASAGAGGNSTAGAGGRGGSGGSGTGGSGNLTCPANATFCSSFDTSSTDPPTGAIYMANAGPGPWTRDFAIDTSVKNSGAGSLRVKSGSGETGTSGSAYKMLAVPATMNAFWVRFFIRSDVPIGMNPHNVLAGASIGSGPNDATIEFADDVGVSFNTSDDLRWPTGYGRINGNMMPYMLAAATWHCVEISFDGPGRVHQLFVGGTQLINATSYPTSTSMSWPLRFFKFGYNALHMEVTRVVWFDDVAVAPTRIGGCN